MDKMVLFFIGILCVCGSMGLMMLLELMVKYFLNLKYDDEE